MAEFIPEISLTEFRKLKVSQLKRLKSCEVYADGQYLFTFVNGNIGESAYLRIQTESKCLVTNNIGGETLEEILEFVV